MSSHKYGKINQIIKLWPRGAVVVQSWLDKFNIYRQLAEKYSLSGWIKRIGSGAYILAGDKVNWTGGLYAIQRQLDLQIYVGALTALELQGYAHFLPLGEKQKIWLFKNSNEKRKMPSWFQKEFSKHTSFKIHTRNLFRNPTLGLTVKEYGTYQILISSPERAMMEYFDLVPQELSLEQGYLLMEGMQTLRPKIVQELLEQCNAVKVKRLFMSIAEVQNHPWVNKVDLSKVDFGKGKRVIGKGGKLDKKYNLSLPQQLNEESEHE